MKRLSETERQSILFRLEVILATLLIVLISVALVYVLIQVLERFGNVIALFTLGAIVAYILNPAVNKVTALLGKRWAGMLAVYGGVATGSAIFILVLFQPLLTQSSSLVSALSAPSTASLQTLRRIESQASQVETELRAQRGVATARREIPPQRAHMATAEIVALQRSLTLLETGTAQPVSHQGANGHGTATEPQLRIPPTYITTLRTSIASLASDYRQAIQTGNVTRPIADAAGIVSEAGELHQSVSTTPVLLLDAQTWADAHHIDVNVQKSAGQAIKKVTDQAMSILNNTAAILTATGSLLVDVVLILLISLYFVSDGARMIHRGLEIVPDRYRKDATFFVQSADTVLGQSIRANIACAAIAGVIGGGGALVLGVPYAVLIGVTTAVLQLIPIIGAILVYIPPVAIALLFTTPTTTVILLVWYIVFEQVVTNVIGPRLTSRTVGIHPLEAMAAALVGFPLAGFLGSFFAVPVVGLMHVLVKQALASRKEKKAAHAAPPAAEPQAKDARPQSSAEATAPVPVHATGTGKQ